MSEAQRRPTRPGGPLSAASLAVLTIDDEPLVQEALAASLELRGHTVTTAATVEQARLEIAARRFDLVLLDLRLHDHSGMDLLPELLEADASTHVVLMTAYATVTSAVEAMRRGAFDYIAKPVRPAELEVLTARVSEHQALIRRLATLEDQERAAWQAPLLESGHPEMANLLASAHSAATTDATVLLTGESGTGKGVLARAMHRWSRRADGAFAVVSCPSLSPELLGSELFGHVKGAFTGAVQAKVGKVEFASGGTLFLDEVGEMSPQIQPRLLRLLQDREYERVGDPKPHQVDVRVIAATNANLEREVRDGRFREDLFYRLNVIRFELPPLRQRREDIPALADSFLTFYAKRHGHAGLTFTDEARAHLQQLPWPGNVRELQNAIERAVILAPGARIGVQTLPRSGGSNSALGLAADELVSLEGMEARYIRHVIETTGSVEAAATVLEVAPSTLWRKRKKYGI
ncbi:MAG: sigma-54 dependent transcriptional regulator [Gemmatimonadota bacterium]